MRQIPLEKYLSFLDAQSPNDFRDGTADEFLTEHSIPENDLAPYIFFRDTTYGRNLIAKTESYELLILTWLTRQRTPIHDHFGQRCWMRIISGSLSFRNYTTPAHDDDPLHPLGGVQRVGSPSQVYIDDTLAAHSITNHGKQPAISLHLYAGPVPQCRIYNEKRSRFETVTLSYFTTMGEPIFNPEPVLHR